MSEPWALADLHRPRWELSSLRAARPLARPRPATIYRTVAPSQQLLERTATADGGVLNLTFALFDKWQLIDSPREGTFMERIARGAFRKTARENFTNIRAVLSHGSDPSLGNTVLGTIESISEEAAGASARVRLFPSVPGLLLDGLKAGVYGASFRGSAIKNHVEYRPRRSNFNPEGLPQITRQEIRLADVGPTPFAAYPGTSAKVGDAMAGALASRSFSGESERPYWELGDLREPYWKINRRDDRGRVRAKTRHHDRPGARR